MIIREIYEALCKALLATGKVKHIDLWNHNVEFIEQETNWDRPAVFIEFSPIDWQSQVRGVRYVTEASVTLHIVTEWAGGTSMADEDWQEHLGVLDLLDSIHDSLRTVDGEHFKDFELANTAMNHNHEDIVETLERYDYVGFLEYGQ